MKRLLLATAALAAAVVVFALLALPPRLRGLDVAWTDGTIPGVLHVHTNRSDGQSAPEDIAAAAAKAGLKFLVFTDHGDATRDPDPPIYRSGVLCLDGVEISTSNGHYIAIGMAAAPYPLGGESRDVVDDVRRLGGFGIAAHPDSPKGELQWTDWDTPVDGLELINPDTSWRVHLRDGNVRSKLRLARALFTYPVRASETIASLLNESRELETRWTALLARRPVVGLAGVDAHARLALIDTDPASARYSLPIPGYEAAFGVLSVHARLASPLTGDAAADAQLLLSAIRGGRVYTTVTAWAAPPSFEFTAQDRSGMVHEGERLDVSGPVTLHVRSNAPAGFVTSVWRGNEIAVARADREFSIDAGEGPGVFRVTVRDPRRPASPPWLISNPIYVGVPTVRPPAISRASSSTRLSLFDGRSTAGWSTESDANSLAAIEAVQMVSGMELRIRYGLARGAGIGQYAGAVVETHGVRDYDRVAFTIRAEQPMRVSIQMRAELPDAPPQRWQRSIYVDAMDAVRTVAFDDMRPVGTAHTPPAMRENVRAVMFIIDTTNSKPGASGRIWIKDVRLEK